MVYDDLDAGDETRRNGDYIGFSHGVADGTAVDDLSALDRGMPVAYDESSDELVADDGTGTIVGVLYAFDVYGDSSNAGPYVDGDSDATVKTSGSVVADLSAFNTGSGVDATDEGTAFGANGEILVTEVFDAENDLAEVIVR